MIDSGWSDESIIRDLKSKNRQLRKQLNRTKVPKFNIGDKVRDKTYHDAGTVEVIHIEITRQDTLVSYEILLPNGSVSVIKSLEDDLETIK